MSSGDGPSFDNGVMSSLYNADSITKATANYTNLTIDNERRLQEINDHEAALLTPVIFFCCVVMLTGMVGNVLVLYIYIKRFKRSNVRVFIILLAVLDFVTCCIGLPYHITDLLHPYTFYAAWACKMLSFFMTVSTLGSVLVLDVIAVDRYRKICKPFERQISSLGLKKLCVALLGVSVFLSWPNAVFYGHSTIDTGVDNITGVECFFDDDYKLTVFPMVMHGINFLIFVASLITLAVLYTFICVQICHHTHLQDDTSLRNRSKCSAHGGSRGGSSGGTPDTVLSHTEDEILTNSAIPMTDMGPVKDSNKGHTNRIVSDSPRPAPSSFRPIFKRAISRQNTTVSLSGYESEIDENGRSSSRRLQSQCSCTSTMSRRDARTRQLTIMLFIITIIFVISFLPHLCLLVMSALDEEFWEDLSHAELVIYDLLLRLYLLNTMVNPVVYSFCDARFRSECKKLARKIFCYFMRK